MNYPVPPKDVGPDPVLTPLEIRAARLAAALVLGADTEDEGIWVNQVRELLPLKVREALNEAAHIAWEVSRKVEESS